MAQKPGLYLAGVLIFCFTTSLYAAHPLITDDTGTQGKGRFQLELNGEYSFDKGSEAGLTLRARQDRGGCGTFYRNSRENRCRSWRAVSLD